MVLLGDVIRALDAVYDPRWAEPWDAVGLVCGDREAPVGRVLLAVDPTPEVVSEALEWGAQLLVTHHPLYLAPTTSVAADTAKGQVIHRLIRGGCGLLVAHTNADVAVNGVNDALADAVGLVRTSPLVPAVSDLLDKLVVFVPVADADPLIDAIAAAGAGRLGDYERCAWTSDGAGTFVPLLGADPTVGHIGERAEVVERRVEMVLPRVNRAAVVRALLEAHPYEEPAYDLVELAAVRGPRGLGRVGDLPEPMTLAALCERIASVLPVAAAGVRAAGDRDRVVSRLAVCGGSGAELAGAAAVAGAQALLTADLKHHTTAEAVADHGVALIDAGHWATEQPWLQRAAAVVAAVDPTTVEARVSDLVTDPWTLHVAARDVTAHHPRRTP